MARYIDADALKKEINGWQDDIQTNEPDTIEHDFVFDRIRDIVDEQETVTVPQWVSVKDRLPEEKGSYLVVKDLWGGKITSICSYTHRLSDVSYIDFDGRTDAGWYDYDSEYGYFDVHSVTHWMPLPEPPKENTDAEEA